MQLFRATDKKILNSTIKNIPNQLSKWARHMQEEDEVDVVFYSAPADAVKARLNLIGYSLENSKLLFERSLKGKISNTTERSKLLEDLYQPELDVLHEFSIEKWLQNLEKIYLEKINLNEYSKSTDADNLLLYMLKEEWFGFPGIDSYAALRLVVEILPPSENLIYDVTDLILGGYYDIEEELAEYPAKISSEDQYTSGKCIILTEGKSDTFILSESLRLLYPHIHDYFTFMDFDGAKIGGGAGSLANMVKSFSGAGIMNKVVAVFDNDTAAYAAIRNIEKIEIAKNIKVFTLPSIEILNNYPTLGPSGMSKMNVNCLAGSIETYLGKECLTDKNGQYYPIQWTGYDTKLGQYQGEITFKDIVQKNFKKKIAQCKTNASLVEKYDWSGIKRILEGIFIIFHQDDFKRILDETEKYYES